MVQGGLRREPLGSSLLFILYMLCCQVNYCQFFFFMFLTVFYVEMSLTKAHLRFCYGIAP